jgi:tetratricopeptide (TPR) repeat protein
MGIAHSRIDGIVRVRKKRQDKELGSGMSREKNNSDTQSSPMGMPDMSLSPSESPFVSPVSMPGPDSEEMNFIPNGPGSESDPADQDLFVGDFSFLKELTFKPASQQGSKNRIMSIISRPVRLAVGINVMLALFVFSVFMLWFARKEEAQIVIHTPPAPTRPISSQPAQSPAAATAAVSQQASASQAAPGKAALGSQGQGRLEQGVSLKTADELFSAKEYLKACYMYQQIGSDWIVAGPADEYIKDYLALRMAVCLHRAGEKDAYETYFSQALQSRCGYVRGTACYYLARIHFQNRDYLEARKRAYQSLALWKAFDGMVSANLERDLYFLIAESLSREVLGFHNTPQELPGRDWSGNLVDVWPTELDSQALEHELLASAERVGQGVGDPRVTVDINHPIGSQWSLFCLNSPLEETLWKAISQAGLKAVWKTDLQAVRSRPISAYLTYVPQQYVMEVLCGSAGLIWQFDGQNVSILDAEIYTDFEGHRQALIQESISIWQRFLLRYRDDPRVANVHYTLGRMHTLAGQPAAAMGEFKLLQGPFAQNPLAPYAYLEASKIKVEIKDYEGARLDLNTMLLEYPDCPIMDEATLYLARATLESGKNELARDLFRKAFQMSLSRGGRCEAALGLGRCAYVQDDWAEAQMWLIRAMDLFEDKNDIRVSSINFMLGKTYLAQGQYAEASKTLRVALSGKFSEKEYVQITLELIAAETRQGNYLEAMNILGSVPQEHLGQQDLCEFLIAKAGILREIDAAEEGVSLLRRKIEFVADSRLRAWLMLELAKCYFTAGDYPLARRELNDALPDMQDAYRAREGVLILARIAEKLNQPRQAETLCTTLLTDAQVEDAIRREAFVILGRVYTGQKHYEKAALAFAGVMPQEGNKP